MPEPEDGPCLIWDCLPDGLEGTLVRRLTEVAQLYHAQTGAGLTITSGRRTLREQARLMAAMSPAQLEGMYCRKGYPDYVRRLIGAREGKGMPSEEDAYRILRDRTEGYVSAHLCGAAVDIDTVNVDASLLRAILESHGFQALDERCLGIPCIHAVLKGAELRLVRQ